MDIVWGVFCQSAIVDRYTNNISLVNIIEELKLEALPPIKEGDEKTPAVAVDARLVTLWIRSDMEKSERGRGRIRIIYPTGESSFGPEFDIDLSEFLRLRQISNIPALPIKGEGQYKFILEYEESSSIWIQKYTLPLRVVFSSSDL